jgi:hypothetical protein
MIMRGAVGSLGKIESKLDFADAAEMPVGVLAGFSVSLYSRPAGGLSFQCPIILYFEELQLEIGVRPLPASTHASGWRSPLR